MLSEMRRPLATALLILAWALVLATEPAQAQCRGGQPQSSSLTAFGQSQNALQRQQLNTLLQQNALLRQQQQAALLQQRNALLTAMQQNASLNALRRQQLAALLQQRNALLATLQQNSWPALLPP